MTISVGKVPWWSAAAGLLAAALAGGACAQPWVAQVERDVDRRIERRDFRIIVDKARLVDKRDGLRRYRAGGKGPEISPPTDLGRAGDQNVLSFFEAESVLVRDCVLTADVVEESLKFSNSRDVVVQDCVLNGGSEDALDIVRGERFVFRNVTFVARGDQAVTIKGGVKQVDFIRCRFTGKPKAGHFIELGNWSDYDVLDRPPTRRVRIDDATTFENGRTDSEPVAVHLMHAKDPEMSGKWTRLSPILVEGFFQMKRFTDGDRIRKKYGRERLCSDLPKCPWK